jgi:hypothetical protein
MTTRRSNMSKEDMGDGYDYIDALEKLCDEHDLLLSTPLINLVTDVIVMVLNDNKEK